HLLVELQHPVLEPGHRYEPGGDRLVDQRGVAPPAVRVRVGVRVVPHHHATCLQVTYHRPVGLEDLQTLVVRHQLGEPGVVVGGYHGRYAGRLAGVLVVLAEGGRQVHHTGTVLCGHEVPGEHLEGVAGVGQVVEERRVPPADQVPAT